MNYQPLAARLRPQHIKEFVGQSHLLAKGKPLATALEQKTVHSMIFWGPPGTGKTTLARLLAQNANVHFSTLSAVLAGVKEVREVVAEAEQRRKNEQKATVLFVDEIHRFNKAQQDAFLPYVEEGVITLIGATTENPSFALNNALLSRARVYVLKSLTDDDLLKVIEHALSDTVNGYGNIDIEFPETLRAELVSATDGDARRCLTFLELLIELANAEQGEGALTITSQLLEQVFTDKIRRFDKGGEDFYDQISALHKSVRGSSPDAALYWLVRMLDGGCDPLYIARRVVRMASEDIGNADPRALQLALNAWEAQERLGSPEGELTLAQAIIYLSCAPKSNAVYTAYKTASDEVKKTGSYPVPLHLRNAPTKLMKALDYGKHYRYAHDEPNAYAAGENYFPDELKGRQYYYPVDRGLEIKIKEKLAQLKEWDK